MMTELRRLVLDANIMVSALIGRSFPMLMAMFEKGVDLLAPVQQLAETRHILVQQPNLDVDWVNGQMGRLMEIVTPLHPALLKPYETRSRVRLHARGQPDWPVLAASLATDAAVWSHDKDFFGSGAPVWSTTMLRRQMESIDA